MIAAAGSSYLGRAGAADASLAKTLTDRSENTPHELKDFDGTCACRGRQLTFGKQQPPDPRDRLTTRTASIDCTRVRLHVRRQHRTSEPYMVAKQCWAVLVDVDDCEQICEKAPGSDQLLRSAGAIARELDAWWRITVIGGTWTRQDTTRLLHVFGSTTVDIDPSTFHHGGSNQVGGHQGTSAHAELQWG